MKRSIEVTVIRHAFREADGTFHRRRVEVCRLNIDESRVIIPPVEKQDVSHQHGGYIQKGRFQFPRRANHIVCVGGRQQ